MPESADANRGCDEFDPEDDDDDGSMPEMDEAVVFVRGGAAVESRFMSGSRKSDASTVRPLILGCKNQRFCS